MIHRVIDGILDGVADGVSGFVSSAAGAIKGAGESVMRGLDRPFTRLTGKEGPHRMIDRAAGGIIDTGVSAINQGLIGAAKMAGESAMKALDHPLEQIGLDKVELPKIFRK